MNRRSALRGLVRANPERGQHSGWEARLRMYGWRSTKRTSVPPAKSRKHGSKAGRR